MEAPIRGRARNGSSGERGRGVDAALCALLFLVALGSYLRTMRPTFGWGDSSELITAAYFLGIGHSPGYPTWMLIAHPFARLPIGEVAFRVNFMNALLGAAAIPLLYAVFRMVAGGRVGAVVGALAFAFSWTFWDITTEADVFTLHICFAALILLLALRWRSSGGDRWLYAMSFVVGISLGNHALTGLMIPALIYLVWSERGWRFLAARRAVVCVALLLVGLSVYIYLPLRGAADPPPHVNNPHSLADVWDQMTAPGARAAMFDRGWNVVLGRAARYLRGLSSEFGYAGCALALAGLVVLWVRDKKLTIFLLVVAVAAVAYASNFSIFDIYTYYLPLYVVWAGLLAVGAETAAGVGAKAIGRVQGDRGSLSPAWRKGLVTALLLTVPFTLFTSHLHGVDGSEELGTERFARATFRMVEPGALILADWWTIAPLGYLKYIEGERPDVTMSPAPSMHSEEDFAKLVEEDFLRRYPAVYYVEVITYRENLIRERFHLVREGPVSRVLLERPPAHEVLVDRPATPMARFGDQVGLTGAEVTEEVLRPGTWADFTLYWTPLEGYAGKALEALVMLENEESGRIWQEGNLLGHDLYPREHWRQGEVLRERHRVYLPEPVASGRYDLLVRVRERGQSKCLEQEGAGRDYRVGSIEVTDGEDPATADGQAPRRAVRR